MQLTIPEILKQVTLAPTKEEKVAVIKKYDNPVLMAMLQLNFNKNLHFDLPEGSPPFKRNTLPIGLTDSNLYNEFRRLYLVIKDHPKRPPHMKRLQVENIFIQILESCHETEADLLIQVKDRQLSKVYKGLTEAIVREAYPTILPEKS